MSNLREQLNALHEAVVEGKCEMGLNLDYCVKHARMKRPGLGSCGPRKRSLMKYAAEMQVAWPEISKQLAAVERVRAIIPVLDRARDNGTVLTYGAVQNMIREALDVTP